MDGNVLLVKLDSRIDTSNAAEVEKQLIELLDKRSPTEVTLDAEKLEYISSVGLRVLLKVKRRVNCTRIVNVSREVYDILNMTGFTQMLDVKKALRQISVEGCRELGSGSFGTTYWLDDETIVKVYHEGVSTEDIERERASAKATFLCGVPTAIPFDTVKVGERFGNVYELINARSLAEAICSEPQRTNEYAEKAAELLKTLANARPQPGSFPKETLFKPNSPRSNEHTRAAEFGTLRFIQRVPRYADISLKLLEQADG